MHPPQDEDLQRAIYESCLDVSFGRSGGCIGVVRAGMMNDVADVVSADDLISKRLTTKSQFFSSVLDGRFQDIDRGLRQELLSVDGATIVNHVGEIIAVGAILKVPAGSIGGGRMAAAKAVSDLGLGVKISEDGKLSMLKRQVISFEL